jgi:hypothetical protein
MFNSDKFVWICSLKSVKTSELDVRLSHVINGGRI